MTYEELLEDNILDVFTEMKGEIKSIKILATRRGQVVGIGAAKTLQEAIDNCVRCISDRVFQCT